MCQVPLGDLSGKVGSGEEIGKTLNARTEDRMVGGCVPEVSLRPRVAEVWMEGRKGRGPGGRGAVGAPGSQRG